MAGYEQALFRQGIVFIRSPEAVWVQSAKSLSYCNSELNFWWLIFRQRAETPM